MGRFCIRQQQQLLKLTAAGTKASASASGSVNDDADDISLPDDSIDLLLADNDVFSSGFGGVSSKSTGSASTRSKGLGSKNVSFRTSVASKKKASKKNNKRK